MSSLLPQKIDASPAEPNSPDGGRHGGVGGRPRSGEYGTVLKYYADTYTSTVHTVRGTLRGVPRLRSSPGEVVAFEEGTQVLLTYEYGDPIILGVVTRLNKQDPSIVPYSVTDTHGYGGEGNNKDINASDGNFRLPVEPTGNMPGDWIQTSPDGNMLGVLAGGLNVMRSGAWAQIRTHMLEDLVEVISRRYRHLSDMGEFNITNENGLINMSFRGGSDQKTETGAGEENWTILFDLGAVGDILKFELCTPKGQTLFKLHVDSDGHCEIFGINGVSINSGSLSKGVSAEECTGDKSKKIQGNQTTEIAGSDTVTVNGNATITAVGNYDVSSANDYGSHAARDYGISSGRSLYMAVQGSALGDAMVFDIDSGNWVVSIGGPTSLNPLSGYKLNTWAGDMEFSSNAGGKFSFTSLLGEFNTHAKKTVHDTFGLPDSVILGGPVMAGHVVIFEYLQSHLLHLYALLDSHTHPVVGTAGPFPVVGTATPLPVFTTQLSAELPLLKSITTGVAL